MEDLPPGFRFYPTEEELISFYLHNKLQGRSLPEIDRVIPVVDIYLHEPWELPRMAGERCRGEREQWFFFTPQQDREARGGKPNRTTATGYWKATGSPGYVFSSTMTTTDQTRWIGVKKTMVFYKGRAPTGKKTHWKMNEYKAIHVAPLDLLPSSSSSSPIPQLRHEMSLSRVYITSGSSRAFDRRPGPRDNALVLVHQPPPSDHQFIMTTTTTTTLTTTTANGNANNISNINAGALVLQESSTDSSGSGGDDRIRVEDQEDAAAGSSSGNMMNSSDQEMMIASGLQPLWEWEQLNWP